MRLNRNHQAFMALVRAGLWEKEVRLLPYGEIDFNAIYKLAQEQSVVGLLAAGLEHVKDVKVPQALALIIAGEVLQLEQRNRAMNEFVADMVAKMREAGIYTLVIKGQGVAQCYERPLWRASGDVDFFLSEENFLLAREFFRPLVSNGFDPSDENARNISAQLLPWDIELHTNQFCGLSKKMDAGIRNVQNSVIYEGQVRSWMNEKTQIFLPSADNDAIFVFTHFLKHFYKGGLGLRQICDWCRLLWTYKDSMNRELLDSRIRRMGLMSEWKAFAAFAVDYLGMPREVMPFYSSSRKWNRKAKRICKFVIEVGNMGHNRDMRFYASKWFFERKVKSFGIRLKDLIRHASIFPLDSVVFFINITTNGFVAFLNRKNYRDYQECKRISERGI